jgi:uncharacterized protein (DUF2384 family)
MIDRLSESLTVNIEELRLKARQGHLAPKEIKDVGTLARMVSLLAKARRDLSLASIKDGDLSSIPAGQLASIVVRSMKDDAALKAAVMSELQRQVD